MVPESIILIIGLVDLSVRVTDDDNGTKEGTEIFIEDLSVVNVFKLFTIELSSRETFLQLVLVYVVFFFLPKHHGPSLPLNFHLSDLPPSWT